VLPFRVCGPSGCLAELELRDEAMLRRLQARPADRPARVVWRDAGNNEASFNLSFRGFAAALDALAREAR
jgi:invasion protein IalB